MAAPAASMRPTRRALVAATLAAWGAAGIARAAGEPIVVHHIGPFSGVLAASNGEAITGARLALDAAHARGGGGGRPVRLQTLDDGQDPRKAAALLDEGGPVAGSCAERVRPVCRARRLREDPA